MVAGRMKQDGGPHETRWRGASLETHVVGQEFYLIIKASLRFLAFVYMRKGGLGVGVSICKRATEFVSV